MMSAAGKPFPGDVGNRQADAVGTERERVVAVAANAARGLPGADDLEALGRRAATPGISAR